MTEFNLDFIPLNKWQQYLATCIPNDLEITFNRMLQGLYGTERSWMSKVEPSTGFEPA